MAEQFAGRKEHVKVDSRGRLALPGWAYECLGRPSRVCTFMARSGTMKIGNHDYVMPRLSCRELLRYMEDRPEEFEDPFRSLRMFLASLESADVSSGRRISIPNQLEELGGPEEVLVSYDQPTESIDASPKVKYPVRRRTGKYPVIPSPFFNSLRQR